MAAVSLAEPLVEPLDFLGDAAEPVAVVLVTIVLSFFTLVSASSLRSGSPSSAPNDGRWSLPGPSAGCRACSGRLCGFSDAPRTSP